MVFFFDVAYALVIFLALYFVFLWVAWLLAVRITRPKDGEQVAS